MGNKDFRAIITELRAQKWEVEKTTQGHWRAASPDSSQGIVHFSESGDHRAIHNTIRDLRRRGFVWPVPSKNDLAVERRLNGSSDFEESGLEMGNGSGLLEANEELRNVFEAGCPKRNEHTPDRACSSCSFGAKEATASFVIETLEERMDRLFRELKEAKAYAALTEEHYDECSVKLKEAQTALEAAQSERVLASQALGAKKREFDEIFSAGERSSAA